jgi:AraC-like DNA-binding protein
MIESKYSTQIQGGSKLDARYLEDFPIALVALFNAVQTSSDDFEQIEPWYSLSHALALKFFRHLSTVQHLCMPRVDATTGDTIVDHSSVISVSRAAYETFLIFSHIFGPEDKQLRRLRFALWNRAGLMERAKYAEPRTTEQKAQLSEEQATIRQLSKEIDGSTLANSHYSPAELKRMNKGDWSGVNKISDLAKQAGLHEDHFQTIYKHSSGHAHTNYISALQVTQARDLGTQRSLATPALGTCLTLLSYFILIFCKMSAKATNSLEENEKAKKIIDRWNLQPEDWILAKGAHNEKPKPTWIDLVRGRENPTHRI